MRALRGFVVRLCGLFRKTRRGKENAAGVQADLSMDGEENLRQGMRAQQALRDARMKFGCIDSAKESLREGSTIMMLETTWQDLKYTARGMRRNPGFAVTAVFSITLGIGASVAIFTLTDNLLLRPLPYRNPAQLMMVWASRVMARNSISPANYLD